jgi:hypothetical protein
MKHFALHIAVVVALLFSVRGVSAQYVEATGGSVVVTATSSMTTLLAVSSVTFATVTYIADPATGGYYSYTFNTLANGLINATSGVGFIAMGGEMDLTDGTNLLTFSEISFEVLNTSPVVTGNEYVNGSFVNRVVIFNLPSNPLAAPFSYGSFTNFAGINATTSSDLISALSSVFGITVTSGTQFATIYVNTRFQSVS